MLRGCRHRSCRWLQGIREGSGRGGSGERVWVTRGVQVHAPAGRVRPQVPYPVQWGHPTPSAHRPTTTQTLALTLAVCAVAAGGLAVSTIAAPEEVARGTRGGPAGQPPHAVGAIAAGGLAVGTVAAGGLAVSAVAAPQESAGGREDHAGQPPQAVGAISAGGLAVGTISAGGLAVSTVAAGCREDGEGAGHEGMVSQGRWGWSDGGQSRRLLCGRQRGASRKRRRRGAAQPWPFHSPHCSSRVWVESAGAGNEREDGRGQGKLGVFSAASMAAAGMLTIAGGAPLTDAGQTARAAVSTIGADRLAVGAIAADGLAVSAVACGHDSAAVGEGWRRLPNPSHGAAPSLASL